MIGQRERRRQAGRLDAEEVHRPPRLHGGGHDVGHEAAVHVPVRPEDVVVDALELREHRAFRVEVHGRAHAQVVEPRVVEPEHVVHVRVREQDVSFARCQLNVTTPGQIGFRVNSAEGLEVRIDGVPMPPQAEFSSSLSGGLHTVTVTVNQGLRKVPLILEVVAGSVQPQGNAELVNQ